MNERGNTMSKRYIADILREHKVDLTKDIEYETECKKHGANSAFIIQAPTGYGKSHYITGEFYEYCKSKGYKILFLLPRSAPTEQFIEETKSKADVITIKTYQSITFEYITTGKCNLNYDYIICDECHYFVTDSIINKETDICFDLLYRSRAFKIYMSATIEPFIKVVFLRYSTTFEIPIQAENTVISDINFFSAYQKEVRKEVIIDIMHHVKSKAIIFCDNASMAVEIYSLPEFKDNSLFICSEQNKNAEYMDADKRKELIRTHKFDCKYLICTSALDVGFSIEDETVKDIVCTYSPDNWTIIMQSIGRKRQVNEKDKATLHIRDFSLAQIEDMLKTNKERFEHFDFYEKMGELEYLKAYRKKTDESQIMYLDYQTENGTMQPCLRVDRFVCGFYEYQRDILQDIQKCGSFGKYLKEQLRISDSIPVRYKKKDEYKSSKLHEIAEEGKIYTFANLEELTKKMNVQNKKRERLKRVSSINNRLQELGLPFEIKTTEDEEEHNLYQLVYIGQDE